MQKQYINLYSAITALSSSLDLVGVDEIKHGKRVALMALRIAQHLDWSEAECLSILYAGMLHDCGVSRIREHRNLTGELEWEGAEEHCIRGYEYLSCCPPLASLALEIRYHHTRWEKLLDLPIDQRCRLRANLLFLADRIDVLQAPFLNKEQILVEYHAIINRIATYSGTLFAPELVSTFVEIADVEAFWLAMEPEYLDEDLRQFGINIKPIELDNVTLKEVAELFSKVVDAKTHFTHDHSVLVAKVARQLAIDLGIESTTLDQIEIAGLLHDIGKLRVSEDIINKPGKLTPVEIASMHRHSYDTFRILNRVFTDSKIPIWAGLHHENLRGEGYPFHTHIEALDLECRIICIADIFQALCQNRPYRHRMELATILEHLEDLVNTGRLDPLVFKTLQANAEKYYEMAIQ